MFSNKIYCTFFNFCVSGDACERTLTDKRLKECIDVAVYVKPPSVCFESKCIEHNKEKELNGYPTT
jgi:hypothetical protein